jgi:hypothetical protein
MKDNLVVAAKKIRQYIYGQMSDAKKMSDTPKTRQSDAKFSQKDTAKKAIFYPN